MGKILWFKVKFVIIYNMHVLNIFVSILYACVYIWQIGYTLRDSGDERTNSTYQ